jgi:hypothetical protein
VDTILQTYSTSTTFEAVFHVTEAAWWTVAFTSCSMNGTKLTTSFTGKFDSGSGITIVPNAVFTGIYDLLVKTQNLNCVRSIDLQIISCEDSGTLPGLTLVASTWRIVGEGKIFGSAKPGDAFVDEIRG